MDSIANQLRNGKVLQENRSKVLSSKDTSKRLADVTLETSGKKRILGDITNKAPLTRGRAGLKSNGSVKDSKTSSLSSLSLLENEKPRAEVSSSQSSKGSSCDDSVFYTTAVEEANESFMDVSITKAEDEIIEPERPAFPAGVEDFDKACKDDVFSVPDYATDIFTYYMEREKLFPVTKYLDKQTEVSQTMRAILVDWMVEVQESFELNHETLYLAVKLVDIYLMHHFVNKSKLQLIGATAVFVAAKFDERLPPLVDDFLYICDDSYTRSELLETEVKILKTVNFDLGIPVSYRFLRRYARCARISMELLTLARFILETSLMDYNLIEILESKMGAASLLLALKMKGHNWTPTLEYYSGYKEGDLTDVMVLLNKNISTPITRHLQTIRTKYSHQIFFEVANVPPLKLGTPLQKK